MSNTYFSPQGNPEVWEGKPDGYFTPEEWQLAHPAPQPEPPTLPEALAAKLAEVMAGYKAAFVEMEKIYPQYEREGWPIQEAEALALKSDPQASTPVLSALVQLRAKGESVADLAAKVLQNATEWRMYYAWYTGQQQRMYAEVSALASVEAVQAYQVQYAPPMGQ